jgi:hypothetical protein
MISTKRRFMIQPWRSSRSQKKKEKPNLRRVVLRVSRERRGLMLRQRLCERPEEVKLTGILEAMPRKKEAKVHHHGRYVEPALVAISRSLRPSRTVWALPVMAALKRRKGNRSRSRDTRIQKKQPLVIQMALYHFLGLGLLRGSHQDALAPGMVWRICPGIEPIPETK